MSMFITNIMDVQRNGSTVARRLPIQIDTVSIDIILSSQGTIPIDSYDAYCETVSFVPARGDYLVDVAGSPSYQVSGNPAIYPDHWECRCTGYLSKTP